MSNRIRALPQLDRFVSQVKETLSRDFPNSFWSCYDLFNELTESDFVTNLINYELSNLVDDALYTLSDFSPSGFFVVLDEQFSLGLAVLEDQGNDQGSSLLAKLALNEPDIANDVLYGLTSHHMIGLHGEGHLELEWYIQEDPYPVEILDKNKTLTRQKNKTVSATSPGCFLAYEDVIRVIPPKFPCTVFYFTTKNLGNIRWEYDATLLHPRRAIATSMNSSRLQWAAESLVELASENSAPSLEKLYTHPDHFVRWSALSNLIQLDYEKGIALLRQAAVSDHHPHVKDAASRSIEMLSVLPVS